MPPPRMRTKLEACTGVGRRVREIDGMDVLRGRAQASFKNRGDPVDNPVPKGGRGNSGGVRED